MDMQSSAWTQLPTCQSAQLTPYDCQSRVKNWHDIINIMNHHYSRMHNSPPMIARVWGMDMKPSASSQSLTFQDAQLTDYDSQSRMKSGQGIINMITVTNMNRLLTSYDCQSRMKNGHGIIGMIIVTNMPECTTHPLWSQSRIKNEHGAISIMMVTVTNIRMHNLLSTSAKGSAIRTHPPHKALIWNTLLP